MKKFWVFGMAVALMAPMAVLSTGPAGAAAGGTSCPAPSGTIKILPGLTKTPKVQTITFSLPLKSCKGGGVTGATIKGSEKTKPVSISTFSSGKPLPLSATITWAPKAKGTSKFVATAKTTTKSGVISYSISSKISTGLFKGLTLTTSGTVGLGKAGAGGAISNLNLKGVKPFVIK
jgi:hypothetical protein